MDDCTSAVSVDVEHLLYSRCREMGTSLITVSHKRSLWQFHDYLLSFDDTNNWRFEPVTDELISAATAQTRSVSSSH